MVNNQCGMTNDLYVLTITYFREYQLLIPNIMFVIIYYSSFIIPKHHSLIIYHSSFIIHHSSSAIHHLSFIVHHSPFIIHHSLFLLIIYHSTFVIDHFSFTFHHSTLIIHYSTFIIHHSPIFAPSIIFHWNYPIRRQFTAQFTFILDEIFN
ncbi:hypothetical protein ACTA71_006599 [Dictyostelium dimigraforme]